MPDVLPEQEARTTGTDIPDVDERGFAETLTGNEMQEQAAEEPSAPDKERTVPEDADAYKHLQRQETGDPLPGDISLPTGKEKAPSAGARAEQQLAAGLSAVLPEDRQLAADTRAEQLRSEQEKNLQEPVHGHSRNIQKER